jgi:hypothetical protein
MRMEQLSLLKQSGKSRITGRYKGTCQFCGHVREFERTSQGTTPTISPGKLVPILNYPPHKLFVLAGVGEFDIGPVHFEVYERKGKYYAKPDRDLPASWFVDLSVDVLEEECV